MNINSGGMSFDIGASNTELKKVLEESKRHIQNFTGAALAGGKELDKAITTATAGLRPLFQQSYEALDKNTETLKTLTKAYQDTYNKAKIAAAQGNQKEADSLMALANQRKAEIEVCKEAIKAANEMITKLTAEEDRIDALALAARKNAESMTSLQRQLRAVREQLALLEANGQRGTELFQKLQAEAGRLANAIGDAQAQAKIFAHDNRGLQGMIAGLNGAVGAFTAAQGAVALFSGENENLQKVMLKVQSLMSITMGLQQVANALNKDSAFMLTTVAKAKQVLAAATNRLTVALGGSTVAAQALMATLTLGLSVAITAIIVALDKFRSKSAEAKKAAEEFNKKVGEAAAKPVTAFRLLQAEWIALTDSMKDREKWVRDNADRFTDLGYTVRNAKEAEDLLIRNAQKFCEAQILKAKALAAQNLATEKYEEILKKQAEIDAMADTVTVTRVVGTSTTGYTQTVTSTETNQAKVKAKKELQELQTTADNLIKQQLEFTTEEQAILASIGQQAGEIVAGSVEAAEKELTRLQGLYKKATSDSERQSLAKQIAAQQAEVERLNYKRSGGSGSEKTYQQQLQARKALYQKYLTWITSTDEVVRAAANKEFAALLSEGSSYLDYLEKKRDEITNKTQKTAADIAHLSALNDEIAAHTKEMVISDFENALQSELAKCNTIGEMLTVIAKKREELAGDNSDVDNKKAEILNTAEAGTKQQAADETTALLQEYAAYLTEKLEFEESYARKRELLTQRSANATNDAERRAAEAALDALEAKRREYANRSGSELYDQMLADYQTAQEQQTAILEKYAAQRAEAEKQGNLTMVGLINAQEQAELSKLAASRLMATESWNELFSDLSRLSTTTINRLINEINAKKINLSAQFDPSDLKAINDQLSKARSELEKRNPFLALKQSLSELRTAMAESKLLDSNDPFVKSLEDKKKQYQEYTEAINSDDKILANAAKTAYADLLKEGSSYVDMLKRKIAELNQLKITIGLTIEGEEQLAILNAALNQETNITKSVGEGFKAAFSDIGSAIDFVNNCFSSVVSGIQTMGIEMDEVTQGILNDLGGIMTGASQLASGIATGNPLSIITGSVSLLSSAFSLFNTRDKKAEKSIKKHQQNVTKLTYAYNALQHAVDNALGETVYQNQSAQIKNLRAQQAEIRAMIADEKSKKKTDANKIAEYEEQIAEAERSIADLISEIQKSITQTSASELADELADALVEAWNDGKTAAEAFGDVADQVLANAVKNALKLQFLEQPLQNAIAQLQKDMGFDSEGNGSFDGLTEEEQARFKAAIQAAGANFAAAMELYKDLFEELDDSDPSTLSGAIKGASQESIDLLAGQTNAVRQNQVTSLGIMRDQLTRLANIDSGVALTNTRLLEILNRLATITSEDLRSQGITGY